MIEMRVESAVRPIAVGTREPRFSWIAAMPGRGRAQSAYRVAVATDPTMLPDAPDLWDSGRIESSQSTHVPYAGAPLRSDMDVYWTVQVWDEAGHEVDGSHVESFGTPLFEASDWQAAWIGMGDPDEPAPDPAVYQHERVPPEVQAIDPMPRAPLLCREFELDQPVKRARAYVCGVGLYEMRLNGAKVGDDVLATPRTDFRQRVLYQTFDITTSLRAGPNVVGLMLGNGWYNGQKKYWGWQMQWYGSPRAIVQIEIEHVDGSTRRIVSDEAWRGSWSPITFNCIYDGEVYDARFEQPGWDAPGFDRSEWIPVHEVPSPGGRLEPMTCEPELVTDRIKPVGMVHPEPGVTVYDFGRNLTGWVQLRVRGAKPGNTIKLRFGEAMHDDGRLNASSNNRATQTDMYICKGGDHEVWEPRFTFHGFQFVEVTPGIPPGTPPGTPPGIPPATPPETPGYPGVPDLHTLEARFVRTAVEQTGTFACGSDLINTIHRCTVQSLMCNVQMGVPTDDTQRPERLGWGCDAWACAHAAFYNLSMPRLYQKWLGDFRDQQLGDDHPDAGFIGMIAPQAGSEEDLVWSSAFILIPWWQYLYHGDRRVLEENYPALRRYMTFLSRTGQKDVQTAPSDAIINTLLHRCGEGARYPAEPDRGHLQISQWGDHLATADGSCTRSNHPLSIATAFYYLDACTMSQIAAALGEDGDAKAYMDLSNSINEAFHQRFYDPHLAQYDTGAQSAQAWPLAFGMPSDGERPRVERQFLTNLERRQRRLTTGYASTRYAIEALANAGRHDLIWKLATATDYPSWGFMLRKGRTTTCEQWDGESGSLNHAPLGAAIDEWFYSGLAGIRPDPASPGYETIVFEPYLPPDLPWAQATLRTPRGVIRAAWRQQARTPGGAHHATLDISVPAGSRGIVHLPCPDADRITEGDTPAAQANHVDLAATNDRTSTFHIASGNYRFTFPRG